MPSCKGESTERGGPRPSVFFPLSSPEQPKRCFGFMARKRGQRSTDVYRKIGHKVVYRGNDSSWSRRHGYFFKLLTMFKSCRGQKY